MSTRLEPIDESQPRTPEILDVARSRDLAELKLVIPRSLLYFVGHFPGFALLPGVVQVDWAVQYATRFFALDRLFPTTIRIKFRKPIRPDHRVTLNLKYLPARSSIQFDYIDAEGTCSSGLIGFASE
jgi:3-hydroxymyristoyl/3-hydroxydecanoyl-(acyl carrier protein) dehydratase